MRNSLHHQGRSNIRFPEEQHEARRYAKGKQKKNPNLIPMPQVREGGEILNSGKAEQCFDDPGFTDWCKYNEAEPPMSSAC
jgi:hypothetical protein